MCTSWMKRRSTLESDMKENVENCLETWVGIMNAMDNIKREFASFWTRSKGPSSHPQLWLWPFDVCWIQLWWFWGSIVQQMVTYKNYTNYSPILPYSPKNFWKWYQLENCVWCYIPSYSGLKYELKANSRTNGGEWQR